MQSPRRATFFDLDGVLYDTLPAYVEAWTTAFREVGIEFTRRDVYQEEGKPGRDTVLAAYRRSRGRQPSEEEMARVLDTKARVLRSHQDRTVMRGARELVARTASAGPVFVVTGSTREGIKDAIVRDFGRYIPRENIIGGHDYLRGKPHPEPYRTALERARVSPEQATVIENAPLGIQSAVDAGIRCLAVNTGVLSDAELLSAGALRVYSDCLALANAWSDVGDPATEPGTVGTENETPG